MIGDLAFFFMLGFFVLWWLLRPKAKWAWLPMVVVLICATANESRFCADVWPWDLRFWANLRPPFYSFFAGWEWRTDWPFLICGACLAMILLLGLADDFVRKRRLRKGPLSGQSCRAANMQDAT